RLRGLTSVRYRPWLYSQPSDVSLSYFPRRRAGLRSFLGQPPGGMSLSSVRSETALPAVLELKVLRTLRLLGLQAPWNSWRHRQYVGSLTPIWRSASTLSGPARPEHRPAATSRRSLQACIASLFITVLLGVKNYLKSDHFNGADHPQVR